jgi:SAM-dependent methyltransferase
VSTTLAGWFGTPLGQYLLAREQAWFDRTVADIFGFQAIQVGLPECAFLAQSRIAARWTVDPAAPAQVLADPCWLPFPENSFDLIVLPHALEFAGEPHQLLREVYRAVRPEGQVLIAGFNPFSLFGARRYFGRGESPPWNGSFIALYRLKDWLALLGFEVTGGGLDCYVPPFTQEKWLSRSSFFEAAGDRWWPIGGGVYYLRATKRVLGMRVITPAWERRKNGLATAPRQARECIERVPDAMRAARAPEGAHDSSRGRPKAGRAQVPTTALPASGEALPTQWASLGKVTH